MSVHLLHFEVFVLAIFCILLKASIKFTTKYEYSSSLQALSFDMLMSVQYLLGKLPQVL